jgi:hypothetical protein
MKCLLCFLALALPGISLAAIDAAQVTELKAGIIERSENPPQHHPVIEVKFVLTRAHQDTQSLPQIDLGDQRAAIVPLSLNTAHAVPLHGIYVNPNMYWCTGWGCRTSSY